MKGKKAENLSLNHHFFFVEVPVHLVAPQAMLWGESEWWPKKCRVRFVREGEPGVIQEGVRYRQKILRPFRRTWEVEISEVIPNRLVRRSFKSGMFQGGYEIVRIEERANGTRIDYEMHYAVKGLMNKLLWSFFYEKWHNKNMEIVMAALKDYSVQKYQAQQEQALEGSEEGQE